MSATQHTHTARRTELLDAALDEFAARGHYAASTYRIAANAGVSQPYFARLSESKASLYLRVVRRALADLNDSEARNSRQPGPRAARSVRVIAQTLLSARSPGPERENEVAAAGELVDAFLEVEMARHGAEHVMRGLLAALRPDGHCNPDGRGTKGSLHVCRDPSLRPQNRATAG